MFIKIFFFFFSLDI